jgi:hypothetical protein
MRSGVQLVPDAIHKRLALKKLDLGLDVVIEVTAVGVRDGITLFMFRNSSLNP